MKSKNLKKKKKNFTNARILSELPVFPKTVKNLTNYQLSRKVPFFPKRSKTPKRLTKHQRRSFKKTTCFKMLYRYL